MDLHLKDQVVLVTGAASGLGKTIALMLAEEGAKVGVNYRSRKDQADDVVREIKETFGTEAVAVYADVSIENDVLAMFDETEKALGPIDALVNNAAYCPNPPCVELSAQEFDRGINANLRGTFLTCRELCRRLLARQAPGRICNVSSQAAFRGSNSGKTAYDASKAGVVGFTRSLSKEMAPHQVNVNAVAPGLMYTDIIAEQIDKNPEAYNKRVPLNRIGRTEEIAAVCVLLCSDRASYMSGATVDVSGGLALH
jgi:3-oxoacyl-[acyl-carrier protein] reductase